MAAKRSEKDILSDLRNVAGALSPENLYRDGEASMAEVRKTAAGLYRMRDRLHKELGRVPTDREVWSA